MCRCKERQGAGNHQRQAHQGVAAHHSIRARPRRRRDSGVAPGPSQREAESGDEPEARGRAAGGVARRPVKMAPDCVGPEVEAMKPAPGEVLLLENLRFHAEEEKNDPAFAQTTGRAVRCLRQRRVRLGASRARLHRGHDQVRAAGRRRPADGEGTEVPEHGHHQSAAPLRRDSGRRQSLRQDRSDPEPGQGGRSPADRRRHGLHVPAGAGPAHRQVAGGGRQDRSRQGSARRTRRQAAAAGGSRGGVGDHGRRAERGGRDDSRRQDRRRHRARDHRGILRA